MPLRTPLNGALQQEILGARSNRQTVNPSQPVTWFAEREANGFGGLASVLTLVLAASECPWKCVMCDLWKHTLSSPTPLRAIPTQISKVLDQVRPKHHDWIKLYNSGSFFDRKSIPTPDHNLIANLVSGFSRVIVENHPRLCGPKIASFQQTVGTQLEVALGVESVQPGLLRRLNKGMDRTDVERAIRFLHSQQISTRAFVLIRPPWNLETEAIRWTQLSMKHLFHLGVRHISLIPVRSGNGLMEVLKQRGEFAPPSISSVEYLLDWGVAEVSRVGGMSTVITVDLWDWTPEDRCPVCFTSRVERLNEINLSQKNQSRINCAACNR